MRTLRRLVRGRSAKAYVALVFLIAIMFAFTVGEYRPQLPTCRPLDTPSGFQDILNLDLDELSQTPVVITSMFVPRSPIVGRATDVDRS